MSDLLLAVKKDLQRLKCPYCSGITEITVTGNSLKINPCCDKFSPILNKEMEKSEAKHAEASLSNIFKKR